MTSDEPLPPQKIDDDEDSDIDQNYDDPDDPYNQMINFKSIRTNIGLETAIEVQWKDDATTKLHLSTLLQEEEIAPLFAGAQWAGTRVWHAAIAMVKYLVEHHATQLQDPDTKLLELGCGLGVPGMLCHKLYGTETYLTDQESIMSQLETNVKDNFADGSGIIRAQALSWSIEALENFPRDFGIVMNCDCIYEPLYGDSWKLLADLLEDMLREQPNTVVLTSCERRNADGIDQFLAKLRESPYIDRVDKVWSDDEYKIEIYQAYGISK